ncbi:hypothetical protein ACIHQR_31725 [Corallococcus coralloides]|uniref:hypothetical protein n=1 Tax=Corallococcus coralloides TaxID=184914 RepID=UPI00384E9108
MKSDGLAAFWGIGASHKPEPGIGYKGHGTKLFFSSKRLSVATRVKGEAGWRYCTVDSPADLEADATIPISDLSHSDRIHQELIEAGHLNGFGTAILIENVSFRDSKNLLARRRVESFCDWFTVIGDVRAGLYAERIQFHQAIKAGRSELQALRINECDLRPIRVDLRINGEKEYTPLGRGGGNQDREFFQAWAEDVNAFKDTPGLLALGHRFADQNESKGSNRARDDLTALRLTTPEDWASEDGYTIVARVEGHRRQRETYLEAQWQNKSGIYGFEDRFGLWLCRDYIPIAHRNDLLREALNRASKRPLQFELGNLRNWQVFVNHQRFSPTANRNEISNQAAHEEAIVKELVRILDKKLKESSFSEWVARLKAAKMSGQRNREVSQMNERREAVQEWVEAKKGADVVDPMSVETLSLLGTEHSLLMRAPRSEQELFYLYGLLSGRYRMPLHVLEYNASQGVDAIALLRAPKLVAAKGAHVRVEFKYEISAQNPIDHFFQAIDVIVCWKIGKLGEIFEQTSDELYGELRRKKTPVLSPPMDTHEIAYTEENGTTRIIPVIQVSSLFQKKSPERKRATAKTR